MEPSQSDKEWIKLFSEVHPTKSTSLRTFKAIVGVQPSVIQWVWEKYIERQTSWTQEHLMWTLSFLAAYCTSDIVQAGLWGKSDNYYFAHVWPILDWLAQQMTEV